MGLKKFFKTKPPTQEEVEAKNKDTLNELGIPTKQPSKRQSNFKAYSAFANDKVRAKVYAPKGYEAQAENAYGEKPYAPKPEPELDTLNGGDNNNGNSFSSNSNASQNPYAQFNGSSGGNSYGGTPAGNPYGGSATGNPYGSFSASGNAYGGSTPANNPYGSGSNTYGSNAGSNPYGSNGGDSYGNSNYGGNPYGDLNRSDSNRSNSYGGANQDDNVYGAPNNERHTYRPEQATNAYASNPYSKSRGNAYGNEPSNNASNPYSKSNSDNLSTSYGNSGNTSNAANSNSYNYALEEVSSHTSQQYQEKPQPTQYQQIEKVETHTTQPDLNQDYGNEYSNQVALDDLNYNPAEHEEEEQQASGFDFDNHQYAEYQPREYEPRQLTEEEIAQQEEDEEVEKIKDQIRFTKQESVASTRNTLRMAREAEESGKNTIGMLGAQSETLYDIERNLALADTQERIGKKKVAEIHHYNRNILKPSIANPFTKSRRLREQEEEIKRDRMANKLLQQEQTKELTQSTNRIKSGLDGYGEPNHTEELTMKYRRQKILNQAKQYQFENNEEDDEMEQEIATNLDEIGKYSERLKKLALTQSDEIDRQNYRLRNIEEDTDRLDVNIHLDTVNLTRR